MDIVIREALLEDSRAIATILRGLNWADQVKHETFTETHAQISARLEQCNRELTHTILVAECVFETGMRRVVAYTAVHWFPHLMRGNDGYISELFVDPAETGKGIGSMLLDSIKACALQRGCTRLLLMNRRIRESYARNFYAKHGWQELEDAAFFSLALPETALATTVSVQTSEHTPG